MGDFIQTWAGICQIVGTVWVLFLGGRTVFDIIQQLQQRRPFRPSLSSPYITNILSIIILIILIANYFHGTPPSPPPPPNVTPTVSSTPTPVPTPTLEGSCLNEAPSQVIPVSNKTHQDRDRVMTKKCKDVFVKFDTVLSHPVQVQLCFPTMAPYPWCGKQPDNRTEWVTFYPADKWKPIATDVIPGTTFYLIFRLDPKSIGSSLVEARIAY